MRLRTSLRPLLLAPALLAALPERASAHGITGRATSLTTLEYVPLGIEHMLLGWDHLLFVFAIVLLAGQLKRAAKLISLFVAGHSLTLIGGTLFEWRLSPDFVDAVIASSVVFVAVLGLRGRPKDWTIPGLVIFAFGLVHGLGLSTRLQDLGIPDVGLLGKTIAFNVGIELGQLIAVTFMVVVVWTVAPRVPRWPTIRRGVFGAIAVAGAVAAMLLFASLGEDSTAVAGSTASCEQMGFAIYGGGGGSHPSASFFGPEAAAPEQDLAHVRGDGYVVVRSRPDLPAAQLTELRAWVEGDSPGVFGAPDPEQEEAVVAQTARRLLSCESYDLAALREFAGSWRAEVGPTT